MSRLLALKSLLVMRQLLLDGILQRLESEVEAFVDSKPIH